MTAVLLPATPLTAVGTPVRDQPLPGCAISNPPPGPPPGPALGPALVGASRAACSKASTGTHDLVTWTGTGGTRKPFPACRRDESA